MRITTFALVVFKPTTQYNMNATEIKNRLDAILAKINDNTAELWENDLETTSLCVKLEKGAIGSSWKSDLLTLVAELDREAGDDDWSLRKCTCCGEEMTKGFVIDDGDAYFCSEACLHKKYTPLQYTELHLEDRAYWTEWD